MNRTTSLSLCGALVLAAMASCTSTTETTDSISFTGEVYTAAYTLDNSASAYETPNNLRVDCRSKLLMPQKIYGQDIADLQDTIRRMAYGEKNGVSMPQDYFKSATEEIGFSVTPLELTQAASDSLARNESGFGGYDGFVNVDGYVESLTDKVLTYAVSTSNYPPRAAHGMYGISYVNYDVQKGRVFGLDDIFTPEGIQALPAIISAKAERMTGSLGQTSIESLPTDGNFMVTPEGDVTFVYQPYEVASFAQGIINVPIGAYTVDNYLTAYGKQLLLSE